MAPLGGEASFSSHGRWRLKHAALVLRRRRHALCEWNERDNNDALRTLVEGFVLGTNAAADRIDVDAAAAKETIVTKVAGGNNDARLLRAF